jgi:hypothetical protein
MGRIPINQINGTHPINQGKSLSALSFSKEMVERAVQELQAEQLLIENGSRYMLPK